MATPKLIFGAGGIGAGRISHTWTTAHQTSTLLESLQALGLTQLDSAGSYPPGAPWVTETLLGESKAAEKGFIIDSKVVVSTLEGGRPGSGHLTIENIKASLEKTLKLLGTERACYNLLP
jgi:aflatoxin B1 aldehyde reductase